MLTHQRKQYLLDLLQREGQIVAKAVSDALGLSEDTIRRDLRELAKEGLLERVHGGALPLLPRSPALAPFAGRVQMSAEAKPAIGRAAGAMIQAGQVVFIDGGTTAVQLARQLPRELRATVVTHSPSIAVELINHPSIEVVMLGGRLYKHSIVGVGAATVEAIGRIRADLYFMGVAGLHPQAGITTGDYEEACVKRALSEASARTIVLASPEKLNTASPFQIAPLSQVSDIVVQRDMEDALLAPYREMGIVVTLA
ncbi:DeoR/GlpR family DNA-binding transcription regulator [Janthinobacterium sp. SUN118]|uniref:DeoR/GlpR family DNA-binding transcription regulator n=1 Tax=Janthinobacterium sp. SUN118 TaxID=3004100 RepID=UPI0025AF97A4|nr:DeoR/GlpR family DNA-binding transcription regulator [Janthinobacterium sp. SUN118]MDN2711562.1 DeoR/GlpR family DNA-binding transcription regulator [Janthinobacterium sp. SUN118]